MPDIASVGIGALRAAGTTNGSAAATGGAGRPPGVGGSGHSSAVGLSHRGDPTPRAAPFRAATPLRSTQHTEAKPSRFGERGSSGASGDVKRDSLQVSDHAALLARLRAMPAVREDRVSQVRSAIDHDTYESADKLALAIERLIDDLPID